VWSRLLFGRGNLREHGSIRHNRQDRPGFVRRTAVQAIRCWQSILIRQSWPAVLFVFDHQQSSFETLTLRPLLAIAVVAMAFSTAGSSVVRAEVLETVLLVPRAAVNDALNLYRRISNRPTERSDSVLDPPASARGWTHTHAT
jgi:hypothetical protein